MSNVMPPAPHNVPIVDNRGIPTAYLSDWLKQLLVRIGGNVASTNKELSSLISSLFPVSKSNLESTVQNALLPTGSLLPFAGSTAPTGYLLCDGSAVSRTLYSDLFTAISTSYGAGDGSTTFNLPNTKGVFLRGAGSQVIGGITYSATLGASQNDSLQGHYHAMSGTGAAGFSSAADNTLAGTSASRTSGTSSSVLSPSSDGSNGTPRTAAETRPANIGVNWVIKT